MKKIITLGVLLMGMGAFASNIENSAAQQVEFKESKSLEVVLNENNEAVLVETCTVTVYYNGQAVGTYTGYSFESGEAAHFSACTRAIAAARKDLNYYGPFERM